VLSSTVPSLLSPTRTLHPFCSSFGVAGHPGTRTVGVFLFGLINERIGDLASNENTERRDGSALLKKGRFKLSGSKRVPGTPVPAAG
jgi:hypothetical protein